MSIAIIECTADFIIFTRFTKKNDGITLQEHVQKELKCRAADWIDNATEVIKTWVNEAKVAFPITILLPDFAVLTKNVKVPKVTSSKQKCIIESHISQALGLNRQESFRFGIRSFDDNEMDVICSVIKKDWVHEFCEALSSIGDKITSIQPNVIHYYNAFNLLFPLTIKNILLLVFQSTNVSCLFIGQNNLLIFKLQIKDSNLSFEIKELIEFHNNKNPDNIPEEVLVAGISMNDNNKHYIHGLSNYIGLPFRIFSPLGDKNAHCLGSVGYAYASFLKEGMFFDLTPAHIRRNWNLRCSKKAFLITGVSLLAAASILLIGLGQQVKYYEQLIDSYRIKVDPLRRCATIIERNEKEIQLYEEGFRSLRNQIHASYSWIHFFNALQGILIKIPKVQILSLKILNTQMQEKNGWKEEMMGIEVSPSILSRTLNLSGLLVIENPNQTSRETISDIKYFMNELTKLELIEEAKNLNFDLKAHPNVPFSIAFALKPQAL